MKRWSIQTSFPTFDRKFLYQPPRSHNRTVFPPMRPEQAHQSSSPSLVFFNREKRGVQTTNYSRLNKFGCRMKALGKARTTCHQAECIYPLPYLSLLEEWTMYSNVGKRQPYRSFSKQVCSFPCQTWTAPTPYMNNFIFCLSASRQLCYLTFLRNKLGK